MKQIPALIRCRIVTSGHDIQQTEEDKKYITALRYELAVQFGMMLREKTINKLNKEIVKEVYTELMPYLKEKEMCQPYFPDLIPIRETLNTEGDLRWICEKLHGRIDMVDPVTTKDLEVSIMSDLQRDRIDFVWLSEIHEDCTLYRVYRDHYNSEKLILSRKDRREIMKSLEEEGDLKIKEEDLSYWKRLLLVLHPEEYKKSHPSLSEYLLKLKNKLSQEKTKTPPPPQKLKNILAEAWRRNTEFEAFYDYLSRADDPMVLLQDYHDLEIRPALSKYKWNSEIEIGSFIGNTGEGEIVETMMTLIKDKIIGLLREKQDKTARYNWPRDKWKNIPATSTLSKLGWWKLDFSGYKKMSIEVSETLSLVITGSQVRDNISTLSWIPEEKKDGIDLVFIRTNHYISHHYNPIRITSDPISKAGGEVRVMWDNDKIKVFDLKSIPVSSILGFIIDYLRGTIRWVGDSSKVYYQGWPESIPFEDQDIAVIVRDRLGFSLSELCEAKYGEPDETGITLREYENY